MRRGARALGALVCALAGSASAEENPRAIEGRCSVRVFASSTLHDFEGSAPCALLSIVPPDANGFYRARAEVMVAQIETGISARDNKMREMFDAKRHPRIVASFDAIDPSALRAGRPEALRFRLSIHGVERAVTPALSSWSEAPAGSARFRASFELSLREFGMEPPLALGFLRVDDRVRVAVEVELDARPAQSSTATPAPTER